MICLENNGYKIIILNKIYCPLLPYLLGLIFNPSDYEQKNT